MASELFGMRELQIKLDKLDDKLAVKSMRSVLFKALTPVVREMKSKVPIGTEAHRTYKKRLVVPTFAWRGIKRITGKKFLSQGRLSVAVGVKAEAFYAIQFLDDRSHHITERSGKRIKPYNTIRRRWFTAVFDAHERQMVSSIQATLESEIKKVASSG
jgi:hypothetical protein